MNCNQIYETNKELKEQVYKLKEQSMKMNQHLIFNREEWIQNKDFGWTEEQIDNADENGLIGVKFGVECYLSKSLST